MFLESGLLKLGSNILLRVVIKNNHKYNQDYGKLKKRIPSKILFIDIEQLSKTIISLQVFFKDFFDLELPTLKMDFFEVVF